MAKKHVKASKHDPIISESVIPTGRRPKKDIPGKFREWQSKAFAKLNKKQFVKVVAATGSGKSRVQKAILYYWNHVRVKGEHLKLIVAIPQSLLKDSFEAETFFLDDGTEVEWASHRILLDDVGSVQALVDFVEGRVPTTPAGRIVICTHAALVRAHQKLSKLYRGKQSPWAGVGICIDEAHHSRTGDAEEDEISNKLGKLVAHYVENEKDVGCLMLATATWMRADFVGIIPEWARDKFVSYVHPIDAHLDSMEYLKEIRLRYVVAPVSEALHALHDEDEHLDKKTIVYLPHTSSVITGAEGGKARLLQMCKEAFDGGLNVDLVTEGPDETGDVRDVRKANLVKTIRGVKALMPKSGVKGAKKLEAETEAHRAAHEGCPDAIFAMNLGKEGFDIPYLERAIVIGPRSSPVDIYQMLGRLLRDFPKKSSVEFIVVLPFTAGKEDPEQLLAYTKTMMASMAIEWQFRPLEKTGLTPEQVAKVEAFRSDAEEVNRVMGKITEEALKDAEADDETLLRRALKSETDDGEEEQEDQDPIIRAMLASMRAMSKFNRSLSGVNDYQGVNLKKSYCIRNKIQVYGAQLGKEAFEHMRKWNSDRMGRPIAPAEMLRKILIVGDLTEKQMHELAENSRRKLGLTA